ncbi:hypothetical protein ABPG72_008345 [Tetrahymena utriculariae]
MNGETKKRNPIWNYYSLTHKSENQYVICSVQNCGQEIRYHNSPTPLVSHVNAKHPEQYKQYEELNSKLKGMNQAGQLLIDDEQFKIKVLTTLQKEKITIAIAKFIYQDIKTLNTVETQGFVNLIRYLEPRYHIPCQGSLRNEVFPNLYTNMKQQLIFQLSKENGFSFTTDYWSNQNMKQFVTITIHFINNNLEIKNFVLKTLLQDQKHTSETKQLVQQALSEYIDFDNLMFLGATADNARNMVKMRKLMGNLTFHIDCFAHFMRNQQPNYIEKKSQINQDDLQLLQQLTQFLKILKDITLFVQQENLPTISTLLPILTNIKSILLKEDDNFFESMKVFKQNLWKEFQYRENQYSEFFNDLALTSLLYPRFKSLESFR